MKNSKRKRFIHPVDLEGNIYGRKKSVAKRHASDSSKVGRKELVKVYNKFYRDQVAALYKAIHNS